AATFLIAAATIIYLKTGHGTLVLEVNEPDVKVTIDGNRVEIKSPRDKVSVTVGPHKLEVSKDGFDTHTESFTIRWRGDKPEVVVRLVPPSSEASEQSTLPRGFTSTFFELPEVDMDQYGNPVVTRDGERIDPRTGRPYEIWLKRPRMEFVYVPPGEFVMGSPENELDRDPNEGWPRRVRITNPLYVAKYELTNGQYQLFQDATGYEGRKRNYGSNLYRNPEDWPTAPEYPIVFVSRKNLDAFCQWLTDRTRVSFRLPTSAEWEYACRAGTSTRFYYGDDPNCVSFAEYAWYERKYFTKTHPVGGKRPNAWGLYDMLGNAIEWVQDAKCLPCQTRRHPRNPYDPSEEPETDPVWTDPRGRDLSIMRGFRRCAEVGLARDPWRTDLCPGGRVCIALPRGETDLEQLGEDVARVRKELHAALKEKNPSYDGGGVFNVRDGKAFFAHIEACNVLDITPLKAPSLKELLCDHNQITDLSPLSGMPLFLLDCGGNPVHDLSPLRKMPLEFLDCSNCPVRDLSPLEGMPLAWLFCNNTLVTDVSPLKGMPLKELELVGLEVEDLSVLRQMPLERLWFSPEKVKCDFRVLRNHPTVKRIGDGHEELSLREFWEKWDKRVDAQD
ncbi:MAG: SUMF1/EgtB/PvdO family nonheme iron enzyme, partial [Planctomycetes bacterium]|nr:SUMF1/EgtB/PvdO family nonheme iron enzyme [Planctomycetota bacterium]